MYNGRNIKAKTNTDLILDQCNISVYTLNTEFTTRNLSLDREFLTVLYLHSGRFMEYAAPVFSAICIHNDQSSLFRIGGIYILPIRCVS